jgi:hypothetical protein
LVWGYFGGNKKGLAFVRQEPGYDVSKTKFLFSLVR